MLDLLGIVFSSVIMMLVIVRALQMDKTEPWFQTLKRSKVEGKQDTPRRWRRTRSG